jgi:hypothetical protein
MLTRQKTKNFGGDISNRFFKTTPKPNDRKKVAKASITLRRRKRKQADRYFGL